MLPSRVGNALGGGRPGAARLAAVVAAVTSPLLWIAVAVALIEPHSQAFLLSLFRYPTLGSKSYRMMPQQKTPNLDIEHIFY